jgi:hypothetical protein
MQARLAKVRTYCLLQLKTGPNYQPRDARSAEQAKIVREHGRRNMQLQAEGKMALVGPVHGAGALVGICIFTVPEAEARGLMDADPAVQAGILACEYATLYGFPGDGLPA